MSKIRVEQMAMGMCDTNCYYAYKEGSTEAILFDPPDNGADIFRKVEKKGLKIIAILLTHGHFDHILGAEELRKLSSAKIYALDMEKKTLEDTGINLSGMAGRTCTLKADVFIKDNEELDLAGFHIQVLATPGHTVGGTCYYLPEEKVLFSGDTLFQESVGRTDFPTGSMSTLIRSIKERLFVLPEEVRVYPGHGPSTTIAYEKQYNPFC